MMFSYFNSSIDTLKESVGGWRGSGRSWRKNPWGVITDVGITFAVRITSAGAGLTESSIFAMCFFLVVFTEK